MRLRSIQIKQAYKPAIPHFLSNVIMLNITSIFMEIILFVSSIFKSLSRHIILTSTNTDFIFIISASHVINNSISNDSNICRFASLNHLLKLSFSAKLRIKLIAHRLIRSPPLLTFYMIIRRRHLHILHALMTVSFSALLSNTLPILLECSNNNALTVKS